MESLILIISLLLFFAYAGLIIFYRVGWQSIPLFGKGNDKPSTLITVIIPARNEAGNIGNCLKAVFAQHYPADLFEVIVVDDHSTDETASIVHSLPYKNLRCIALRDFVNDPINSYKKKAIEVAVAAANGDLIVTTDADCFMGNKWLSSIASFYEQYQPAFIAAPVSINCSNRFIEMFQALDFMVLQGITGASVQKKLHSMCNGANLAYEKKAFTEVNGFSGIDNIASGDDMLLMHKINSLYPDRVLFLKSPEAIVYTEPVATLKAFLTSGSAGQARLTNMMTKASYLY